MKTMKKLMMMLAAFAAAACTVETVNQETDPKDTVPAGTLLFRGARPSFSDGSRTEWNGSTVLWSEGDRIGIGYTVAGAWQTTSGGADLAPSDALSEGGETALFAVPDVFTGTPSGDHKFYSAYPAAAFADKFSQAPSLTATLPVSQKPEAASFDPSADLLAGQSAALPAKPEAGTAVDLDWTRLVAHAQLVIRNLSLGEGETLGSVTLQVQQGAALAGSCVVDLTTGAVTPLETVNTLTLDLSNCAFDADGNLEVWAAVFPLTVTELTLSVETSEATYSVSFSGISKEFMRNMRNRLAISMKGCTKTVKQKNYVLVEESLSDWSGHYLIAYTESGNTAKVFSGVSSNIGGYATLDVLDGKNIPYSAAKDYDVEIIPSSGKYLLKFSAQSDTPYLKAVDSNSLNWGDGDGTAFLWSLSYDAGDVVINSVAYPARFLQWNKTNPRFACYKANSNQSEVQLYRFDGSSSGGGDVPEIVLDPAFDPEDGTRYVGPDGLEVAISSATPGATVHYTTDGSEPTSASAQYGDPILLTDNATVKAVAVKDDKLSHVVSATYTVIANTSTEDRPYTAAEAGTLAARMTSGESLGDVYVTGTVVSATVATGTGSGNYATYSISEDGTDYESFDIYKGKNLDGADFSSTEDLLPGDVVVVKGTLVNYKGTTPELTTGSMIVSLTRGEPVFDPKLTTRPATGITKQGATLNARFSGITNWNETGHAPTDIVFRWGSSEDNLDHVVGNHSVTASSGAFTDTLTDELEPEHTYYYRAEMKVWDPDLGDYRLITGEVVSFTTLASNVNENVPVWYELPYVDAKKSGNYLVSMSNPDNYFAFHICPDFPESGPKARNYTVCFSGEHHVPLWVAAPRHAVYETGSGRSSYSQDSDIPKSLQYQSTNVGGNCNKGHMLGSAERTCTDGTNKQVFYYTNIAPQLSTGFNTGSGGWNILEDFVDHQVCSDTLYVVIGTYFNTYTDGYGKTATAGTISFGGRNDVGFPTMFYYILLRTRNGNTGKALKDCSADEIMCAAFVRAHTNDLKGQAVTKKEMMSVSALEAITGFTYFPNVPNAPKDSFTPSDWGVSNN